MLSLSQRRPMRILGVIQIKQIKITCRAFEEAIKELEEASLNRREWYQKGYNEAMKHKECCLICKDRSGCKFADNVRDNFGINSNEMWFSCFKTKDIK